MKRKFDNALSIFANLWNTLKRGKSFFKLENNRKEC